MRIQDCAARFAESIRAGGSSNRCFKGASMTKCEHLHLANLKVKPSSRTCKECVALGQSPVELRMCLVCGNVACCDSSPGRHATKHFQETGHPMMKPLKSGNWMWCYVHQA